jgi:drug/metabolite transporter (DMT)-like permease
VIPPPAFRAIGIALAVGGTIGFSLRPVLVKVAYGYGADPVTLLALRMVFSIPFLLAAAAWTGQRRKTRFTRHDWAAVIGLGALGYYLASFLDFLGLQYVSAGLGRLLLFLYPTIVVILTAMLIGRKATRRELAALALTYSGVALVMSAALDAQSRNIPLGAALVFAGAIAYAIYLVAATQLIQRIGSVQFTAYSVTAAAIFCIAQFLAVRPFAALDLPMPVYAISLAMAVFCTVVPTFMTSEALRRIGANHVALIGALGPVSTIFVGFVGLDEMMTPFQLVGVALVLAGVLLVSLKTA